MDAKLELATVDWCASHDDVYRMLAHVHEFFGQFSDKDYGLCKVSRPGIKTLSDGKVHNILITAQGMGWSQYLIEYGHEFCHVYTNVWKFHGQSHWINEVICELGSLCCLNDFLERTGPNVPEGQQTLTAARADIQTQLGERANLLQNKVVDTLIHNVRRCMDVLPYEYDPSRLVQKALSSKLYQFASENLNFWRAAQYLNDYDVIPEDSLAYLHKWHARAEESKDLVREFSALIGLPLH